jgi:hypothetical protein
VPPAPASAEEAKAEASRVLADASKAMADGRRVFLCRIPMMYDRLVAVGTSWLPTPSVIIEQLEDMGWRLDQMSWVPRPASAFRAEGIFLFRRDSEDRRP